MIEVSLIYSRAYKEIKVRMTDEDGEEYVLRIPEEVMRRFPKYKNQESASLQKKNFTQEPYFKQKTEEVKTVQEL